MRNSRNPERRMNFLLLVSLSLIGCSHAFRFLTGINLWYKTACIAENIKAHQHYICDRFGKVRCLPGFQNEDNYCQDPICDPPCVAGKGNCTQPDQCSCEIGYTGDDCAQCVRLPGCVNGNCSFPFECACFPGWTGLFCDKPICRAGCVNGHCSVPGECHCHPGWTGRNCTQCIKLPGCSEHGSCTKPLECKCDYGWKGNFCHKPKCSLGCSSSNGFCYKPHECWCYPGWTGPNCETCVPYPGCEHGSCIKPWECNCNNGYVGSLCNRKDTDPTTTPEPYNTTVIDRG